MKLEEYLKTSGISQRTFAKRVGISSSSISMWLSGNRNPSTKIMKKIEDLTSGQVTMQELFNPNVPPQQAECQYRKKKTGENT